MCVQAELLLPKWKNCPASSAEASGCVIPRPLPPRPPSEINRVPSPRNVFCLLHVRIMAEDSGDQGLWTEDLNTAHSWSTTAAPSQNEFPWRPQASPSPEPRMKGHTLQPPLLVLGPGNACTVLVSSWDLLAPLRALPAYHIKQYQWPPEECQRHIRQLARQFASPDRPAVA